MLALIFILFYSKSGTNLGQIYLFPRSEPASNISASCIPPLVFERIQAALDYNPASVHSKINKARPGIQAAVLIKTTATTARWFDKKPPMSILYVAI